VQIAVTLLHASASGVSGITAVGAAMYLVKAAILDTHAWWRLIVILAAGALLWLLLNGDAAHLVTHIAPLTGGTVTAFER
jgi:hypothetical protein